MKKIGFVGLGDMGLNMALNVIKSGFDLTGFDLRQEQMDDIVNAGGHRADSLVDLAKQVDFLYIMVMHGYQVMAIIDEILDHLKAGDTIAVSATIKPAEMNQIEKKVSKTEIHLIDTPVSGGLPGAKAGTLTLMCATPKTVLEDHRSILEAVSGKIFHVGDKPGQGQTVKAVLQSIIGSTYTAIFESLVMGAKAGISGQVMNEVFSASGASSPILQNCIPIIMDRKFKGTGSHIATMYKDLGISVDLARDVGTPLFMGSTAYEMFQAGIAKYPENDNWTIVKVLEEIAGTEVNW